MYEANIDKTERKMDSSTIIVGDFHSVLFLNDRTIRLKINKEREDMNTLQISWMP